MDFDLSRLATRDRHKLLTGIIVPRPIAWVTTRSVEGRFNAAPYSFFNMMGSDPPVVAIGVGNRPDGTPKDTGLNIRATNAFVVNIVDEALAAQMNITATTFDYGVDELETAGLTTASSVQVDVPRIAEAPASLECREVTTLEVGRTRIVLGEVIHLHLRDDLVDSERLYVQTERLGAIGRMHGGGWYARTTDLFRMDRKAVSEVLGQSG